MTQNLFISFEGGEGVGKTTLLMGLASRLEGRGADVICTREPGGTPIAEALRNVLLDPTFNEEDASPTTEALILAAARRNHVEQKIEPALKHGSWVLCDRYIDSTRAYQGSRINALDLRKIEALATGGLLPDLTILLDAEPSDLLERRQQRGQTTDRFERRSLDYHRTVRKRFLDIAAAEPRRIVVLNALQTPDELIDAADDIITSTVTKAG